MPLHTRVQRAIRQLILDGALEIGRPLPASRALARSLEISRDTVERAYSQLHAEGFIDRRTGSGSFISTRAQTLPGRSALRKQGSSSPAAARLSQRGKAMLHSGGVRDFWHRAHSRLVCRKRGTSPFKLGSDWSDRCLSNMAHEPCFTALRKEWRH